MFGGRSPSRTQIGWHGGLQHLSGSRCISILHPLSQASLNSSREDQKSAVPDLTCTDLLCLPQRDHGHLPISAFMCKIPPWLLDAAFLLGVSINSRCFGFCGSPGIWPRPCADTWAVGLFCLVLADSGPGSRPPEPSVSATSGALSPRSQPLRWPVQLLPAAGGCDSVTRLLCCWGV